MAQIMPSACKRKKVKQLRKQKRRSEPATYCPMKIKLRKSNPSASAAATSNENDTCSSSTKRIPKCFICNMDDGSRLWKAATFELSDRVKYCAKVT